MNEQQRAAALRLADVLDLCPMGAVDHEVSALLRELLAEPAQKPQAERPTLLTEKEMLDIVDQLIRDRAYNRPAAIAIGMAVGAAVEAQVRARLAQRIMELEKDLGECSGALELVGHPIEWQSQAEPVATLHDDGCFTWKRDEFRLKFDRQRAGWRMDVYAHPPQRKPLTKVQITELAEQCGYDGAVPTVRLAFQGFRLDDFARAVERAHGIGETKC